MFSVTVCMYVYNINNKIRTTVNINYNLINPKLDYY